MYRRIILLCLCFVLSITIALQIFLINDAKKTFKPYEDRNADNAINSEVEKVVQPEALTEILTKNGYTYDDLSSINCSQLVLVSNDDIKFYEFINKAWIENIQFRANGFIGKNGLQRNRTEGDGTTPMGLFSIGNSFYIDDKPDTKLDSFKITDDVYWVDDPESDFYNQLVYGTAKKDWKSAEHMIDYNGYRYGFVINYNIPAVFNSGSAIFFHIGEGSTDGCIATSEEMVLKYLSKLDKDQNPHILIESN